MLILLACADKPQDSGPPYERPDDTAADTAADSAPPAVEDCSTPEDDDGDGSTDAADALNCTEFYADADGDGVGADADSECRCAADAAHPATVAGDCEDADPSVYPGAPEWCDGVDTSCSGTNDAGLVTLYLPDGTPEDQSDAWGAGTSRMPAEIALSDGVVNVCPGTWYVNVTASGDDLTVRGVGAVDEIVLDGGRQGVVLSLLQTTTAAVEGVTIQNGESISSGGFTLSGAYVDVHDCVVQDNESRGGGGGGEIWGDVVTVRDTVVRRNLAGSSGGGLFFYMGSLTVTDVTLEANVVEARTEAGGGALAWRGSNDDTVVLEGVTAVANSATTESGAASGGAIWLQSEGRGGVTLQGLHLEGNSAIGLGGPATGGGLAVYSPTGALSLADVQLLGNSAIGVRDGFGGGASLAAGAGGASMAEVSAADNVVVGTDGSVGGGIALSVSSARIPTELVGLSISGNSVRDGAGVPTGSGGGLYVYALGATPLVTVESSDISGNSASVSGGAQLQVTEGSAYTLTDVHADDNEGDGVRFSSARTAGTVEIVRSSFQRNSGAGVALLAEDEGSLELTLADDATNDSDLGGNASGLELICRSLGGACAARATSADFLAGGSPNLECDVATESSCLTGLGDDVGFICWSDSTGGGCD